MTLNDQIDFVREIIGNDLADKLLTLSDQEMSTLGLAFQNISELRERDKNLKLRSETRESFTYKLRALGYLVDPNAPIWRINRGENEGYYGLQVGTYEHSCHIDNSTYIVLLVLQGNKAIVEKHSDFWLSEAF